MTNAARIIPFSDPEQYASETKNGVPTSREHIFHYSVRKSCCFYGQNGSYINVQHKTNILH